jgi:hypothetical protein
VLLDALRDPGVLRALVGRRHDLDERVLAHLRQGAKDEPRPCDGGRWGARVAPAQPVPKQQEAGLLEKPDAGLLILLVLRRSRRAVDVVVQRVGAEGAGKPAHVRQQCESRREIVLAPVGVNQDQVGRHVMARQRPERGACDGPTRREGDMTPLRPRRASLQERLEVVAQLGLVGGPGRDREKVVARRLPHAGELEGRHCVSAWTLNGRSLPRGRA